MLELYKNIRQARLDANITQAELAKRTGYGDRSSIAKIEKGLIDLPQSKIELFAKALGVSSRDLMGYDGTTDNPDIYSYTNIYPVEIQKIPVLGKIACGQPIVINEEHEYYVKAGTKIKVDYALVAQGDSMINARIYDGDLVFLRKDQEIVDGEIYAVAIDDEITLKRVYRDPDQGIVQLVAENPKYRPLIYSEKDGKTLNIIGKAVFFQADVL